MVIRTDLKIKIKTVKRTFTLFVRLYAQINCKDVKYLQQAITNKLWQQI